MNKGSFDQVKQLLILLDKTMDSVEFCIENGKGRDAMLLLEQCQNSAIAAGTVIEEAEGQETEIVKRLEEYCEEVYQLHEILSAIDSGQGDIKTELQKIKGKSSKLVAAFEREVKVKKLVLFLPYKASMWDSLESVWKKAAKKQDVEALVVPIPYFDKNPKGEFETYHYEGELFPKDVPIVNYQDIDIEELHPDEIYIHNPYDDYNYVTSIHPDYYSKNLKEYTDCLIYIPYFVLQEVDPENKPVAEKIYHYAQTMGVINADKVIVQSEAMRQVYIDAMCQLKGEDTRSVWEKKIYGTGSPKFDKVVKVKREDVEIPEEWKWILLKEDGSFKKVILYNTSVTALLNADQAMLEKIKDNMRVFKDHKEDVALLWRPHPLMKATISSMKPELWAAYEKLVEEYKADGFGIYDDTADMDRAIALADAYYGDPSSMVQLCQKVGMPIMIQNPQVLS